MQTSSVDKNKLIAARLRSMAETLLYFEHSETNFARLEQYLRESVTLHPEATENYLLMAKAYNLFKSNNKIRQSALIDQKIVSILDHALKYDPHNSEAKILYAMIFISHGNWQLALDYLKDILGFKSDSFVLEQLGNCYFNLGKVQEAFDYFSLALKLQPRHHVIHTHRGVCCLKLGDFNEAYSEALRSLILAPNFKNAIVLKKEIIKYISRNQKMSASATEKELDGKLTDILRQELFSKSFEIDPLTGFSTEGSLQLWSFQSTLKTVSAITANLASLREASLLLESAVINENLKNLSSVLKELYPEAIFLSRPRADKFVIFLTSDATNREALFALRKQPVMESLGLFFGFGEGSIQESLAASIKNSFEGMKP